MKTITIFSSVARTVTENSIEFSTEGYLGGRFFLNITAASGTTPTLDVKLQTKDDVSGTWFDIPGAAFLQATAATGDQTLAIFPGVVAVANVAVNNILGSTIRAVATIGAVANPSFTFTLSGVLVGQ